MGQTAARPPDPANSDTMPLTREALATEAQVYGKCFVGPVDHTTPVHVDVSALTNDEVDSDGYLKPGVPLGSDGLLVSRAYGLAEIAVTGGAAGALVATGVRVGDTLVSVYNESDNVDVTDEFTISDTDEIDNAGETATTGDTLSVKFIRKAAAEVHGVTVEAIKVAASNVTADLNAATDVSVAVALIGVVNQAIAEDDLGRAYTAAELAGFSSPDCLIKLV